MAYSPAERYVPMEKASKVAVSGDATANYIDFVLPYSPVGVIAQVRTVTTGVINLTGLTVTVTGTTVRVAVTDLLQGDTVSVLAFL